MNNYLDNRIDPTAIITNGDLVIPNWWSNVSDFYENF
jgi:hypothetical protein